MFRSTRELIDALDHAGELRRVSARVDPILEIAAITDRVSKAPAPFPPTNQARLSDPRFFDRGGPALLFENVEGSDFPVLINAFGSYRRMEIALGVAEHRRGINASFDEHGFESIAQRIASLVKPEPPRSLRDAIAMARRFAPLARIAPKRSRRMGPCQEVITKGDHVDLRRLPIIRCWPLDADLAGVGYPPDINADVPGVAHDDESIRGRYITLAGVHTIHPDDARNPKPASHNIGMYRVQLLGPRTMAMHWHMHHDGAAHWRAWKKTGRPMPVAIALGAESVLPYAATCPLPPGISELLMAGFLNHAGIRLCRALTVPLWVPANAEFVIEGLVSTEAGTIGWDPRDESAGPLGEGAVFEGPFGDHTGFYSMPDRYPILEVTAVTHRRDAVYPTTIVGLPPQEDYYLGKATERIMRPLLKTVIHDIEDYDLPLFGAFHNAAAIAIKKQYPLHARRTMHAIWGAGQMSWTKSIFIVEDDVDVHDTPAVLRAAAFNCRPDRDIERVRGPLDILDHAAPRLGVGTKLGFDCTRRWPDEDHAPPCPHERHEPCDDPGPGVEAYLDEIRAVENVTEAALPEALAYGWLFVTINKSAPGQGRTAIDAIARLRCRALAGALPPFIIVLGPDADPTDIDSALFHWCANTDAARDALVLAPDDARPAIAFDATPKVPGDEANNEPVRAWPPIIRMSPEIVDRVERRWDEYAIS